MSPSTTLALLVLALHLEVGRARFDAFVLKVMLMSAFGHALPANAMFWTSRELSRSDRFARSATRLTYMLFWPLVDVAVLFMRPPK